MQSNKTAGGHTAAGPLAAFLTTLLLGINSANPAFAEGPMNTDDAGTLDKGGMKIEAAYSRDDGVRGGELLFGLSLIENLEMEITLGHARDDSTHPDMKFNGIGFGAKWVPYQNEKGWSVGARFDYGRTSVNNASVPEKFTEHAYSLTGLASYRLENGQALHLNAGMAHGRAQGSHETLAAWGIGYELPLTEGLQLTVEAFGESHSGPDKAIGLRYEVLEGFKVYAAIGNGNSRNFSTAGFAWEF